MDGWEVFVVLMLLVVVILLIVIGPIFTIWSLNVLFALEIPYSFKTWAAMVWIHTILHGIRASFKKSNEQQNNE